MITRMRIRNFKSFGPDGDWFPLGRLTLILGENSSGKSTILQTLLLMSQSWQAPLQFLKLCGDGEHFSAGPLKNHTHFGRPIPAEFAFEIDDLQVEFFYGIESDTLRAPLYAVQTRFSNGAFVCRWIPKNDSSRPHQVFFVMENFRKWLPTKDNDAGAALKTACEQADAMAHKKRLADLQQHLNKIKVEWAATLEEAAQSRDGSGAHLAELDPTDDVWRAIDDEQRHPSKAEIEFGIMVTPDSMHVKLEGRFEVDELFDFAHSFDATYFDWFRIENGLSSLADSLPDVTDLVREVEGIWSRILRLRNELAPLSYIGPTRAPGQRVYVAQPSWRPVPYVGRDGKFLAAALHEAGPGVVAMVNRSLRCQGVPYSIKIDESVPGSGALAVKIYKLPASSLDGRDATGDDALLTVDLCDVGFGISQLLPVLAQLNILRGREINTIDTACLVVEQPELHLHPKWQAELASELVNVWPEGRGIQGIPLEMHHRVQTIVETHSELMVLRIARLIRTGAKEMSRRASSEASRDPIMPISVLTLGIVDDVTTVRTVEFDSDGWFDRNQFFEGFFADRIDEEMAT